MESARFEQNPGLIQLARMAAKPPAKPPAQDPAHWDGETALRIEKTPNGGFLVTTLGNFPSTMTMPIAACSTLDDLQRFLFGPRQLIITGYDPGGRDMHNPVVAVSCGGDPSAQDDGA